MTSTAPDGRSGGRTTIALFVFETMVRRGPAEGDRARAREVRTGDRDGGPLRSGPAAAVSDAIVGVASVTSALSCRS